MGFEDVDFCRNCLSECKISPWKCSDQDVFHMNSSCFFGGWGGQKH